MDADPRTDEIPVVRTPSATTVWVAMGAGALVAVALGVYGRLHDPTGIAVNIAGFSTGVAAKAWLASAAFVLALVQLGTAMAMYGRLGSVRAGPLTATVHRWSGRVAVLLTVPVAVHCLYALGFQGFSPRTLVHSLLGCFFYGAFVTKMLLLSRPGGPRWALPVVGGLVFTVLTGVWLTSSVWFFATRGVTF